jgi:beta-N-acetylhexosaminidase
LLTRTVALALVAWALLTGSVQAATPTVKQMAGQLIIARMHGKTPSKTFLRRVGKGQIGGVVLYNSNFDNDNPAPLIHTLQRAARLGHQPPLLIAVDQEGGEVKRLTGAPSLAPPQMANPIIAEAQGLATARNLHRLGINVDLAPVLDVDHGGFIGPRTFGATPAAVSRLGTAFAAGLARGRVDATAKHFPGLGYATLNTDDSIATVHASRRQLHADWLPFRAAIAKRVPLVMMSTAVYPALGSRLPAVTSPKIVAMLRRRLGFHGVIVTDALQTPNVNHYYTTPQASVGALAAGVDMVLAAGVTDSTSDTDGASTATYAALTAALRSGHLPIATVRAAYLHVLGLKRSLSR